MQSTYEPLQLGEMEAWQWEQIGCELTDPEKLIFSYAAGRYIGTRRKDGYEDHRFKARGKFLQENGHPPHTGEEKQNRFAALLDLTTSLYQAIWPEREQAISKIISSGLNPEIIKEQTEWLLLLKQEQDNLRAAYAAGEAIRKQQLEEHLAARQEKLEAEAQAAKERKAQEEIELEAKKQARALLQAEIDAANHDAIRWASKPMHCITQIRKELATKPLADISLDTLRFLLERSYISSGEFNQIQDAMKLGKTYSGLAFKDLSGIRLIARMPQYYAMALTAIRHNYID